MSRISSLNELPARINTWYAKHPEHAVNPVRIFAAVLAPTTYNDDPQSNDNHISHVKLPFLEGNGAYNRVGGAPPAAINGVKGGWPCFDGSEHDDKRMEHVFTADLRGMKIAGVPNHFVAVTLMVSSNEINEAYSAGSGETAVYFWTAKEMEKGWYDGDLPERDSPLSANSYQWVPLDVPMHAFTAGYEERENDEELQAIHRALYNMSARIGGPAIWLQDKEHASGNFFMQFDEGFVSTNLGDSGIMYVFTGDAFWQCY